MGALLLTEVVSPRSLITQTRLGALSRRSLPHMSRGRRQNGCPSSWEHGSSAHISTIRARPVVVAPGLPRLPLSWQMQRVRNPQSPIVHEETFGLKSGGRKMFNGRFRSC
jgi:hypothetical protein